VGLEADAILDPTSVETERSNESADGEGGRDGTSRVGFTNYFPEEHSLVGLGHGK